MSGTTSPCRDCLNRNESCHGDCQLYLEYRKQKDEEMERSLKRSLIAQDIRSMHEERVMKNIKRKHYLKNR